MTSYRNDMYVVGSCLHGNEQSERKTVSYLSVNRHAETVISRNRGPCSLAYLLTHCERDMWRVSRLFASQS